MENIENILKQILESQNRMENRFDNLENRFDNLEKKFDSFENNQEKMKSQLTKLEISQEKMQKDIELLAEGHKNILECMERQHKEIRDESNARLDEVEAATANLAGDIKFIKHKEFQNEESLFKLKETFKLVK